MCTDTNLSYVLSQSDFALTMFFGQACIVEAIDTFELIPKLDTYEEIQLICSCFKCKNLT